MSAQTHRRVGATTEQLRHDIDSGLTGDKVAASDPAAAPLGTDDEAAGTPPSAAAVELARRTERRRIREPHPPTPERSPVVLTLGSIAIAALAVIALVIAV